MSLQIVIILVPVLFGFMGFAIDLGRLYLVRGELKAAADSMALAAAQKLTGTDASVLNASTAARLTINNSGGFGNRYDFGGLNIGETNGNLNSEVPDPTYFETVVDAVGGTGASGSEASGATAKYARVSITADAPLTFWSFLSLGQARKTPIAAQAVAGVSAPLCTACGIEPIAIAALDATDTVNFGLTPQTRYTLGYQCAGAPTPGAIGSSVQRIQFLLLDRLDADATLFPDESSQLYRIGAQGLPPSVTAAKACVSVDAAELVWATAVPLNCNLNRPPNAASNFLCGLAARFDSSTVPTACANVVDADTILSAQIPDTDITDLDDYTAYAGNGRRVITIPIVDALSGTNTMTILGFRQFLVEPNPNDVTLNPSDVNARFAALYIGNPVPVKQGSFSGCQITNGPGKVVLHQ
ncbi:MAG: pilus assembly protein TadG-related protein [Bryobacteraceae bacterium]